jgi:hypothetical protein
VTCHIQRVIYALTGYSDRQRDRGTDVRAAVAAIPRLRARAMVLLVPLVLLATAGTAGCGELSIAGEATPRQASAGAGASGKASPAHPRASGTASPAPPRASGTASAAPSPAHPRARWRQVRGSSVTAVGDSVLLGSAPAVERRLPGIYIDAAVSRQFEVGLQVIASLAASGELRPIVVVGLGTNGTVTAGQVRQLLAEIGPERRLVLVNTYESRPWEAEDNATLDANALRYRRVVLANWFDIVEHHTDLLSADDVHPQLAGTFVYARMLNRAVQAAGNLPS